MGRGRGCGTILVLVVIFVALGAALLLFGGQGAPQGTATLSGPTAGSSGTTAGSSGSVAASSASGATSAHHVGPANLYPDPALTPGDVLPGVTAQQVCVPGYSGGVRSVSSAEKAAVYRRYGIPDVAGKDEVDHFVSLELGGSNDLHNLWPEPYAPAPGAHEKDKVEDYLHAQVCKGAMTLAQAQQAIRSDWYAVYQRISGS